MTSAGDDHQATTASIDSPIRYYRHPDGKGVTQHWCWLLQRYCRFSKGTASITLTVGWAGIRPGCAFDQLHRIPANNRMTTHDIKILAMIPPFTFRSVSMTDFGEHSLEQNQKWQSQMSVNARRTTLPVNVVRQGKM
jgi:hypothetical protein